jgi:peptidoglycan hydrolase-like protein with peptidoglycan-binding domain
MIRGGALIAAFLALAVLAGCGGSSTTTTTTAATTTAATTTTSTTTGTTTATADTNGASLGVAKLQVVMTSLGFYTGPIDGLYGPETTAAVKSMQQSLGVTADGMFGPETYVALKANAKVKAKTTAVVVQIQATLKKYGYYTGPIDGVYGDATTAAVKQLQTDLGVTADGKVGPETVVAFNKAVATGQIKPTTG